MRVVVTGATGFIGRALLRMLHTAGVFTIGVARSSAADLPIVRVTSYSETPTADMLIHLAETRDRAVAEATGEDGVAQAVQSLKEMISRRFKRIVYISSAAVYGDRSAVPHPVTDPVYEDDFYTQTKIACEKLVLEEGGLVARLSNVYGPSMAHGNVLSTLLKQIPGTGPVSVWNTNSIRDFLWIEDAVRVLTAMACSDRCGIYNVGSGNGNSVAEIAHIMLQIAGEKDRPVVPLHSSNRFSVNIVDIRATMEDFGWTPNVPVRTGIRQLLENKLSGGAK